MPKTEITKKKFIFCSNILQLKTTLVGSESQGRNNLLLNECTLNISDAVKNVTQGSVLVQDLVTLSSYY